MEDTFIDKKTITPTERLCFIMIDRMNRLEDKLDELIDFKKYLEGIQHSEIGGKKLFIYSVLMLKHKDNIQDGFLKILLHLEQERVISLWMTLFPLRNYPILDFNNIWNFSNPELYDKDDLRNLINHLTPAETLKVTVADYEDFVRSIV